jgi:23S rRNA (uracil1939-C5)-methyltransferase
MKREHNKGKKRHMVLEKDQIIELNVEKLIFGGEGLGYFQEMAVFVPMSVPGDRVKVKIISVKKSYARGIIEEIIKPGEERVEDYSKITFEDFHGCDFGMLKYEAQLKYKKEMVEDVLKKIGKIENCEVYDTIGSDSPKYYRNKVIEPFAFKDGKIISGFFKKKSHEVFEVSENMLQSQLANNIIKELKEILNKRKIPVYDERKHRGVLRHVMVRTNSFGEAMVVLIVKGEPAKNIKKILFELRDRCPEIKSAYISINDRRTNFALGEDDIYVYGDESLKEELFGIKFNISPKSFFQINMEQTDKLYKTAISFFDDVENKNIVDAYSGTGTIAMILSGSAKKVFGIEVVKSATQDAIKTSVENKIKNIEFVNGKVEEKLVELLNSQEKIDSIIFDPPRKGIEEKTLHSVGEMGIKEIVYISCNPSTFARDADILNKIGYALLKVQPVDMFPQTSHIEVVGKFVKRI